MIPPSSALPRTPTRPAALRRVPAVRVLAVRVLAVRVLAVLALVGLLARALLPAGVMAAPPANGTIDGTTTLVICASSGLERITLDADGHVIDRSPVDDQSHSGGHDCPCVTGCGAPAFVLPDVRAMVVAAPALTAAAEVLTPVMRAVPPLPARGPPLGSRAPPSFLG